jgi:chorismate mutase/prephenate dehydratase
MIRIAIQGVRGSYSEEAATNLFGTDTSIVECPNFEATFAAVRRGDADHAVIPVENKIVGRIAATTKLLRVNRNSVIDKLPIRVRHVLAGVPDASFEDIVSVRSHIEALKQCRKFFAKNPNIRQVVGADTASSIRNVIREGDAANAAICSRRAAELYGADIILDAVADDVDNWTVFYVIGN